MEMESQEFLELVGKAEGHLGSVDRPLDALIGRGSAGERLFITIVNLSARDQYSMFVTHQPLCVRSLLPDRWR